MELSRTLGPIALCTLTVGSAACTAFQWSSRGPGAPGTQVIVPATVMQAASRPVPRPTLGEPTPFSTVERERIAKVRPWVQTIATRHQLDPDLVNAIIWVESRFVVRARSPAGAQGLMQLMPATARAMAKDMGRPAARSYDPRFNIEAGSLYLLRMLDRFDGDETLALAAYNAGSGNVGRWMREDGVLPPRSLQYVDNVQRARHRFVALRQATPTQTDRTMLAAAPTEHSPSPGRPTAAPTIPPSRSSERPPSPPASPNPLAPSPDVYRPDPPLEPPLADTPYPPIERPRTSFPDKSPDSAPSANVRSLPSVLD